MPTTNKQTLKGQSFQKVIAELNKLIKAGSSLKIQLLKKIDEDKIKKVKNKISNLK